MKIKFTLFLFFVIAFTKTNAQDTIYLKKVADTVPTTIERALYYKVINKNVFPVEVSTFHMSGQIITKEHFSSLDSLIYHGEYTSYFYNGSIHIKGEYSNGRMEGWWVAYNKDPYYLKSKQNFKNNLQYGKSFTIYPNGKPKIIELYVRDTLTQIDCYDSLGVKLACDSLFALEDMAYEKAEVKPEFPGGLSGLMNYLVKTVKYPPYAREKGLEGKVVVRFYIDTDGSVKNPAVIKDGVGGGAAQEAIRVINSMPKWSPASQQGKPVKVYYTLPITFKLQ